MDRKFELLGAPTMDVPVHVELGTCSWFPRDIDCFELESRLGHLSCIDHANCPIRSEGRILPPEARL